MRFSPESTSAQRTAFLLLILYKVPFSSKSRNPAVCPDVRQLCLLKTISSENNGAHNLIQTQTVILWNEICNRSYDFSHIAEIVHIITAQTAAVESYTVGVYDSKISSTWRGYSHQRPVTGEMLLWYQMQVYNFCSLALSLLFLLEVSKWKLVTCYDALWQRLMTQRKHSVDQTFAFHYGLLWSTASQTESFWRICPLNQDTAYESTTISVITTHLDSTTIW